MKTIFDFNFNNEKALIRVDFNVPRDSNLKITDITRIISVKPTINKILSEGGAIILMTHLGRPKGNFSNEYSLKSLTNLISKILKISIKFIPDCIGENVLKSVNKLKSGEVLLLENLRFYPEEEQGDYSFAKELSKNGTIYVNDAFSVSHRIHSSTAIIPKFFNSKKCIGSLMLKEINAINKVLKYGKNPITAILGGSKVSSKITIINSILPNIDNLIIGGGMAYTFIKALGGFIGSSLCENEKLNLALSILDKAKKYNVSIHLPDDTISADSFNNNAYVKHCSIKEIPIGFQGLDIGIKSIKKFTKIILQSKTILWNGPLGVFEMENFSFGTKAIIDAIEKTKKLGTFSLVGGGDSVAFLKKNNYDKKVSYISTGGGAMLEYLESRMLPGIAAIL